MALIDCYECNNHVSDSATSCPKCGAPVQKQTNGSYIPPRRNKPAVASRKVSILLVIGVVVFPYIFAWFLIRKNYSVNARTAGFCWLGLCVVLPIMSGADNSHVTSRAGSPEENVSREARDATAKRTKEAELADKAQRQRSEIASLPLVTASRIAQAYEENTVAADQIFKGKRFRVTGNVLSISTDFLGRPYITLDGGINQFMEPQFSFGKDYSSQVSTLRRGDKITLVCKGRGDVAKTPMSDDCMILQ